MVTYMCRHFSQKLLLHASIDQTGARNVPAADKGEGHGPQVKAGAEGSKGKETGAGAVAEGSKGKEAETEAEGSKGKEAGAEGQFYVSSRLPPPVSSP